MHNIINKELIVLDLEASSKEKVIKELAKETERFNGLPIVKVGISDVVKKSDQIIDKVQAQVNSKK